MFRSITKGSRFVKKVSIPANYCSKLQVHTLKMVIAHRGETAR